MAPHVMMHVNINIKTCFKSNKLCKSLDGFSLANHTNHKAFAKLAKLCRYTVVSWSSANDASQLL